MKSIKKLPHRRAPKKRRRRIAWIIVSAVFVVALIVAGVLYSDSITRLVSNFSNKVAATEYKIKDKFFGSMLPVSLPENAIFGIDISHFQGKIEWAKVNEIEFISKGKKESRQKRKLGFVIAKATEGTKGANDPDYSYNMNGVRRKEGVVFGAYHLLSFKSEPTTQAANFLNVVDLKTGDLRPVLDVEPKLIKAKLWTNKETLEAKVRKYAKEWMEIVTKKYGVKPILYTSKDVYEVLKKDNYFNDVIFWIASLTKNPPMGCSLWQFSENGIVDGINGGVDVDVIVKGDLKDLCLPPAQK